MKKGKGKRSKSINRRKNFIPKITRRTSAPKITTNTVFGEETLWLQKVCDTCMTLQPFNNFYCISASKRKLYGYEDHDPRSREKDCCYCWDEAKKCVENGETLTKALNTIIKSTMA